MVRLAAGCVFLWTAAVPDIRAQSIPVWIPVSFAAAATAADLFLPSCIERKRTVGRRASGRIPFAPLPSFKGKTGGGRRDLSSGQRTADRAGAGCSTRGDCFGSCSGRRRGLYFDEAEKGGRQDRVHSISRSSPDSDPCRGGDQGDPAMTKYGER